MSAFFQELARERADWLLDAIACATQDRKFLRGDPAYDEVVGEAILLNGEKAILTAFSKAGARMNAPTNLNLPGNGDGDRPVAQALAVSAICDRELAGTRWSKEARHQLRDIQFAALGVVDGIGDAAEMHAALADWADEVSHLTFPRLSDAELAKIARGHRRFLKEAR